MSGGSMNYAYGYVNEAAEHIQHELANAELRRKSGRFFDVARYYQEKHPDVGYLKSPESLTDAVIERLRDALVCLRQAAIYAKRVEWLTSGDDGYESFCILLDEKLSDCKKHGGVE